MKRLLLPLFLLTVAVGFADWKEDTLYRVYDVPESGNLWVYPGETTEAFTLTHYHWPQLWVYGVIDTISGKWYERSGPSVRVEWRWGTYDAYAKTRFYYGDWQQALPTPWLYLGEDPDSMMVYDSLYCGPLIDPDVPMAWMSRMQLRAIGYATSDTCILHLWNRRRFPGEAGDALQWPFMMAPWFFPN